MKTLKELGFETIEVPKSYFDSNRYDVSGVLNVGKSDKNTDLLVPALGLKPQAYASLLEELIERKHSILGLNMPEMGSVIRGAPKLKDYVNITRGAKNYLADITGKGVNFLGHSVGASACPVNENPGNVKCAYLYGVSDARAEMPITRLGFKAMGTAPLVKGIKMNGKNFINTLDDLSKDFYYNVMTEGNYGVDPKFSLSFERMKPPLDASVDMLNSAKVPTKVVFGSKDKNAEKIKGKISTANPNIKEVKIVDGHCHLQMNMPQSAKFFAEDVDDFFSKYSV